MSIARKSHRHFERVPAVAEVAHHDCSRRRAEGRPVDATEYVTRMDSSCLQGIGRVHEKFGTAEVKRGMEKSALGCRAFAAGNGSGAPARCRGIGLLPRRLTRFITRSRSNRTGQ